jgi:hypothetical protein
MSILVNKPFWKKGMGEKNGMKVKEKKEVKKILKNRS